MPELPLPLATVEQVCERNPEATRAAAQAVLDALAPALAYVAGGAPDDALVSLNRPLMLFEPVADLLSWFSPELVNDAMLLAAKGEPYLLICALDAMGLWAQSGEAYARLQQELGRAR